MAKCNQSISLPCKVLQKLHTGNTDTFSCLCDPNHDSVTIGYELELNILEMYLHLSIKCLSLNTTIRNRITYYQDRFVYDNNRGTAR